MGSAWSSWRYLSSGALKSQPQHWSPKVSTRKSFICRWGRADFWLAGVDGGEEPRAAASSPSSVLTGRLRPVVGFQFREPALASSQSPYRWGSSPNGLFSLLGLEAEHPADDYVEAVRRGAGQCPPSGARGLLCRYEGGGVAGEGVEHQVTFDCCWLGRIRSYRARGFWSGELVSSLWYADMFDRNPSVNQSVGIVPLSVNLPVLFGWSSHILAP